MFVISVLLIFFDYWSDPIQEMVIYQILKTISGFSFGFIENILICHIADNVTKHHRGCVALNISLYLIALPSILSLGDFNIILHYFSDRLRLNSFGMVSLSQSDDIPFEIQPNVRS